MIPQIIICPHCKEIIKAEILCNKCDAKIQALTNNYPEIFQETVFDKLYPKLDEILLEINNLKDTFRNLSIRGLKLKTTKIK